MTIDEIKQALSETKEICAACTLCDGCTLAIGHSGTKICPMRLPNGDLLLPFEWRMGWPEDEDSTMRSMDREE